MYMVTMTSLSTDAVESAAGEPSTAVAVRRLSLGESKLPSSFGHHLNLQSNTKRRRKAYPLLMGNGLNVMIHDASSRCSARSNSSHLLVLCFVVLAVLTQ